MVGVSMVTATSEMGAVGFESSEAKKGKTNALHEAGLLRE